MRDYINRVGMPDDAFGLNLDQRMINNTINAIRSAIEASSRPVLILSGGKDSLLVLELCQAYRNKLQVVWGRTTSAFPHMVSFVRETCAGWDFIELVSDQAIYFKKHGVPLILAPSIRRSPPGHSGSLHAQAESHQCCQALLLDPIVKHIKAGGFDLVIHGQTKQDIAQGVPRIDTPFRGIKVIAPIAEWTSNDVLAACLAYDVKLPKQYRDGLIDSLECWNCTANIDQSRIRWISHHYPQLAIRLSLSLHEYYGAINSLYATLVLPGLNEATAVLTRVADYHQRGGAPINQVERGAT